MYRPHGMTVFLDNYIKLDMIFADAYEIKSLFTQNNELEFLLNVARIGDISPIQGIVSCKK